MFINGQIDHKRDFHEIVFSHLKKVMVLVT